jgi:hypothetical protein
MIFQGNAFQSNAFQLYESNIGLIPFQTSLSEERVFAYVITAINDAQAAIYANLINPSSSTLPTNVYLQSGPVQKMVSIISLTDTLGNYYPTNFATNTIPTPSVNYVPPLVLNRLYMVTIQEVRHVNYSFIEPPENLANVFLELNPSVATNPISGTITSQPIIDSISIFSIADITGGTYRIVFILDFAYKLHIAKFGIAFCQYFCE